ncbi:MAG: RraA family protein [Alphaproteobacteria bacterium]|nr:RraA family protein [Alphaproteobacteria bacterium]
MPNDLIERFRNVATASVADAVDKIAGRTGYLDHEIKPRINDKRIVGPAVTVLEGPTDEFVPPQHALDAIDDAAPGSVIVIAISGETNVAVWGGLMTAGAVANKHEGAVLDGGVRDLVEIKRDFDFPIFARSVSPGTTLGRHKTLASGVAVPLGNVIVHPGDLIVGDPDGVVVVPHQHAQAVLDMAEEIDQREAEQTKLILDAGSLREGLAKYGRI